MRKVLIPVFGAMALACGGLGATDYGDCPAYLDCADEMGMPTATLEATYGEEGSCWDEDPALCRAACTDSLEVTCPDEDVEESADCSDIVGTGNAVGQVAKNFTVPTQNAGESFTLHDHCDSVILLVTSAMWEPVTVDESASLEALYQDYKDRGLEVVLLLGENEDSDTPSQQELKSYADRNGLSFTVGSDADFEIEKRFRVDNGIPSYTLLDRGAVVHLADDYFSRDAIPDLL